jgi:hypothetical protein
VGEAACPLGSQEYNIRPGSGDIQSCPIQDEPEAAMCFQHKMSLKGPGMLGVDHQHGTGWAHEPGTDPDIHGSKPGDSI